jgi:HKD family nuclease
MSYFARPYLQDATTGRIGGVLDAITAAAECPYNVADIAVAYATRQGVKVLTNRLSSPKWDVAQKRFLISIDFGITEPAALAALAALSNAHVRIPNGLAVLNTSGLWPPKTTFHTKVYIFHVMGAPVPLGLTIGSANISVSALATGAEAVAFQAWEGKLSSTDQQLMDDVRPLLEWFDDAWEAADPLDLVLSSYRSLFKGRKRPQSTRDDRTPAATTYIAPPAATEVTGSLAVQLLSAQALWVKTDVLYHNRGPGKPGNQLDTPRGTRVFFGFPATQVGKNTILGYIDAQVTGFNAVRRSVRYADNSMDKVNLPIPERDGPASYDNAYLIFDRTGLAPSGVPLFQLVVTDLAGLNARRNAARNSIDLNMASGRPYGLFF